MKYTSTYQNISCTHLFRSINQVIYISKFTVIDYIINQNWLPVRLFYVVTSGVYQYILRLLGGKILEVIVYGFYQFVCWFAFAAVCREIRHVVKTSVDRHLHKHIHHRSSSVCRWQFIDNCCWFWILADLSTFKILLLLTLIKFCTTCTKCYANRVELHCYKQYITEFCFYVSLIDITVSSPCLPAN